SSPVPAGGKRPTIRHASVQIPRRPPIPAAPFSEKPRTSRSTPVDQSAATATTIKNPTAIAFRERVECRRITNQAESVKPTSSPAMPDLDIVRIRHNAIRSAAKPDSIVLLASDVENQMTRYLIPHIPLRKHRARRDQ